MLEASLAYKYVVLAVMLADINYYGPRLQLPIEFPVRPQDIRTEHISPASFHEFSGRIDVKNYSFVFYNLGWDVYQLDANGRASMGIPRGVDEDMFDCMDRAARMKYVINTNNAYPTASNWLAAMEIDVKALEKQRPPVVGPGPYHSARLGLVPCPFLTVRWQDPAQNGHDTEEVSVEISSVTGELMELVMSGRPFGTLHGPLIKDVDKLAAISNEEFLKYSPLEKSNLVARYSAWPHPVAEKKSAAATRTRVHSAFDPPQAYAAVARSVMLAEINYYAARLHLPMNLPVTAADIESEKIAPPGFHEFTGTMTVHNYVFHFAGSFHDFCKMDVTNRKSFGIPWQEGESVQEYLERLSAMKSIINTNEVFQMASNCLLALDFDLPKLEKSNHPDVAAMPFRSATRGLVTCPRYTVNWHQPSISGASSTEVKVVVSGVTGELLELSQEIQDAITFTKEPLPLIKDYDTLAAISDEEFLKYSPLEQSNLVVRFSNLQHPAPESPAATDSQAVLPAKPN